MDSDRFDNLTRALGSRRTVLGGLLGSTAAALLGFAVPGNTAAHDPRPACRRLEDKQKRAACLRRARKHIARHRGQQPGGSPPGGQPPGGQPPGCTPNCAGKNCGSNGCGGTCGTCGGGRVCSNSGNGGTCQCPAVTCAGVCCAGGQQCFGTACWPDGEEVAFITLINNHRAANGRAALALQNQLGRAAELHSQDQAAGNFSNHTGSNGSTPDQRIAAAGYAYSWWGENIYFGGPSASEAFTWWRNSTDHNNNMLSTNFTQFGIARAQSSAGVWYWTTTFGRPA